MDNFFKIISGINLEMNNYIQSELEKRGYSNIHISHGNILINFKSEEELNYKQLSKRINKSPQTMTTHIRTLEKEGYITQKTDPDDRRNKLVSLTEKGKKFIPVMIEISKELHKIQYKNITQQEQEFIREKLNIVKSNFGDVDESKKNI